MLRKSISMWVILILLSLALGLLDTARAQSGYDPAAQTQTLLYNEARTVYLGNLARRDNGIPPLRWNKQLTQAARWFSWDSTENRTSGFCGHQDTQGHWPDYRALAFGYLGGAGAENAFCGYLSPESAIQGWMNSPGHRANLLDPNSREIGLGYYRRDSDGRGYVTQDFGNDAVYAPVIIENEAISTTNGNVNLYIYDRSTSGGFAGLGAATQMMVSNNPYFYGAVWEPYNTNKVWTLTNGDGWRDVYVKTRDKFNRTLTASDTIYLGANVPLNELGAAQMSTTQSQVTLYDLDGGTLPQVQFSLGWMADDTFGSFNKLWGNGERIDDAAAWGGTTYRLYPGNGESFAWVYDTTFIKDTPLVAYFRLKVNNNTSSSEVARISIQGGPTEYGPISLRGADFTTPNQYQEFILNFTFTPTSQDPFLIFKFWRSANTDLYIDAVSIFTAPQPVTSPLTWSVPGGNYRGQGVWARYTNGSQFSALFEAATTQLPTYTLSGNVGAAGATLSYVDGTPKTVIADASGNYTFTVPYSWSSTVTPSLASDAFCPASQMYSNLTANKTAQNYAHEACRTFGSVSRWTSAFDLSHGWTVKDFVRTVGDVNNDGRDDLIGFGLDGVYVALSTGTGFGPISRWTTSFDLSHGWTVADFVRTVGDVNNDGRDDLIGFGLDGVYVALSNGTGFGPISRWTTSFDLSHGWTVKDFVRTVGDVNNDGRDDLIGFGLDGVYVALSNGTSFGSLSRWTTSFDLSHGWTVADFARTVGDVNNDGRDDLIGFGQDGVYVALSNGTSFDAISQWTTSFDLSHGWTVAQYARTVGDINGDGKADLIGFGQDGVYIALSTGNSFTLIFQGTSAFDLSHGWTVTQYVRTVGDVTGDGKTDLVGFGLDGVYVVK